MTEPEEQSPNIDRLEQLKLIYDYTKFHLVLCLLTPTALKTIADAYSVQHLFGFRLAFGGMVTFHLISSVSSIIWLGTYVNTRGKAEFPHKLEKSFSSKRRRLLQPILYWTGLGFGIAGLVLSFIVTVV